MGMVSRFQNDLGGFDLTGKCLFCEQRSSVYWQQPATLELCTDCAMTFLPRLLADAVVGSANADNVMGLAKHGIVQIEATYWRAVASHAAYAPGLRLPRKPEPAPPTADAIESSSPADRDDTP